MRFSVASALAALPLLARADGPQYQAQFQNYLDKVSGYIPSYSGTDPVGAAEAKAGSMNMHVLTLKNWKETLYSFVQPGSTTPEDFWLFTTGGNKTCFGRCDHIEKVFNQTAAQFALMPDAPPVGYLNCEKEPVLCNTWSIPTGVVWVFEMLPEPAEVEIWTKRFNTTTATPDDIVSVYKDGYKKHFKLHEGAFHPWKGWFAKNNLALPVGWVLFVFNMFPSWMLMLAISFISRTFMTNRMQTQMGGAQQGGPRPAAAGQAVPR